MPAAPIIIGIAGIQVPLVASARPISHKPTIIAAATTTRKRASTNASDTTMIAIKRMATPIEAGRSRPARLFFASGADSADIRVGSDFEQLGFLVLEQVVDLVNMLLRHTIEPLLGP